MDNYKFIEIGDENIWQSLIVNFCDSNLYHAWNYSKIVQKEKNLKHIALYKKDKLISVFQIRLRVAPILNRGIAYIFKGPVWQKKNGNNSPDDFKQIILAIKNEYAIRQKFFLRIRPFLYSNSFNELSNDTEIKSNFNIKGPYYNTLILDLKKDIAQIRKEFKSKWRNHLNNAERNSIELIRGTNQKLSNDFIKIYKEMLSRKKFTENVDLDSFIEFINQSNDFFKPNIIIAYQNQEPVSGMIFCCLGSTGISLFRATNEVGMKTNASYLVQYDTIKWLKDLGADTYDLGGIDPINNPSVYNFKLGISNTNVTDLGIFETHKDKISKILVFLGESIYKVKSSLKTN